MLAVFEGRVPPGRFVLPPDWEEKICPSRPLDAACCADGPPVTGWGENSALSAPRTEPCGDDRSLCMASREIMLSRSANALRAFEVAALSNTALILISCRASSSALTFAEILSRSASAFAVSTDRLAEMAPAS